MAEFSLSSPLGNIMIKGDEMGISELNFIDEEEFKPSEEIPEALKNCADQLAQYFKGDLKQFKLRLNPKGTGFQQVVWKALLEIPYGKTLSYLQVSKNIGNVKAIRAVAGANGRNLIPIIIPCHRVIGSDGSLTGYSGGLWRKEWLLKHEQILQQTSLF